MFRRLNLIKSGRDDAVYGEKVIILNTFFCSLNNVSSHTSSLLLFKNDTGKRVLDFSLPSNSLIVFHVDFISLPA